MDKPNERFQMDTKNLYPEINSETKQTLDDVLENYKIAKLNDVPTGMRISDLSIETQEDLNKCLGVLAYCDYPTNYDFFIEEVATLITHQFNYYADEGLAYVKKIILPQLFGIPYTESKEHEYWIGVDYEEYLGTIFDLSGLPNNYK